jgi:hypothetical protein
VLDIETDSTIQLDENAEKQRRAEFIGVLAQLLPQLTQMIQIAPDTAPFCGEVLKFATAPFRAGRALSGSIDDLVSNMTEKASAPRGDDPATQQSKAAIQIEQMKDTREREKNKQDAELQAAELKMKDDHAKAKLASDQAIAMAKMKEGQNDEAAKAEHTNLQMMHDREKHQADMLKTNADMAMTRQKADLATQASIQKQGDMAARADERRQMQQFKMTQRPPGGGGVGL